MTSKPPALPRLRPHARQGAPLYAEMRALTAAHGAAMAADVQAYKNTEDGKITLARIVMICLRYRLSIWAGFAILEDAHALAIGTYDRLKASSGPDDRPWSPTRAVQAVIDAHGLPDAAPGIEAPL